MIKFKVDSFKSIIEIIKKGENFENVVTNNSMGCIYHIEFVDNSLIRLQNNSSDERSTVIEILLSDVKKMLSKPSYRPRYCLKNAAGVFKDVVVFIHQHYFKFMDHSETKYFYSGENHSCLNEYFVVPRYDSTRYRDAYIYINYKYNKKTLVSLAKDTDISAGRVRQILCKIYRKERYYTINNNFKFITKFPYCNAFMKKYNIPSLDNLKRVGKEYLIKFLRHYTNELNLDSDTRSVYNHYIRELINFATEFDGDNTFDSVNRYLASFYQKSKPLLMRSSSNSGYKHPLSIMRQCVIETHVDYELEMHNHLQKIIKQPTIRKI